MQCSFAACGDYAPLNERAAQKYASSWHENNRGAFRCYKGSSYPGHVLHHKIYDATDVAHAVFWPGFVLMLTTFILPVMFYFEKRSNLDTSSHLEPLHHSRDQPTLLTHRHHSPSRTSQSNVVRDLYRVNTSQNEQRQQTLDQLVSLSSYRRFTERVTSNVFSVDNAPSRRTREPSEQTNAQIVAHSSSTIAVANVDEPPSYDQLHIDNLPSYQQVRDIHTRTF